MNVLCVAGLLGTEGLTGGLISTCQTLSYECKLAYDLFTQRRHDTRHTHNFSRAESREATLRVPMLALE